MRQAIFFLVVAAATPWRLGAGINVWTSHGPGGGPVQAVAIDPKNPATIYAVAATGAAGQVFKSTDGGANWNSASSGLKAGISGLIVDPQNPSTVYGWGSGLFKSTDGGQSWNTLPPPAGGGVAFVALDPQNPSTLYASFGRSVFKSTDAGNTWSAASSGLAGSFVITLVVDPQNSNTVYALTGSSPSGIFKSTDGGASWNAPLRQALVGLSQSSTGTCDDWGYYFAQVMGRDAPAPEDISCLPPDGSRDQPVTVDQYLTELRTYALRQQAALGGNFGLLLSAAALVIDAQKPSTLYAEDFDAGVLKSTDGGLTWNPAHSGMPVYHGQTALAIDPTNSATLYAGQGGLFKSVDGAASWSAVGSGLPSTGGSVTAMVVNPQNPRTVYAAGSFGVFKSADGAASWSPANSGLALSSVLALAVDPQHRGTVFAGTSGGAGGVSKSGDGGTTWTDTGLAAGFTVSLAVDPQNPSIVYASTAYPIGFFKSTDGGVTWTNMGLTQVLSRLTIDPQNPSTLYANSGLVNGGILKSMDGGATWRAVNSGLMVSAGNATSAGLLALDPQSPNTLYAIRSDGQIFRTTDGAGSWSTVTTGWDTGIFHLGGVAADPQNPGTLYVGTQQFDCEDFDVCPSGYYDEVAAAGGTGLFRSSDGGNSWTRLDALPAGNVFSVAIDPQNSATLYATIGPLYGPTVVVRSTDGGASWKEMGPGLVGLYVTSLAADPQDSSTLYAATSGGGVFSITLASQ